MSFFNNSVLYIEPNYNVEMDKKFDLPQYSKDIEDYCIYVDLLVQVYDRVNEGTMSNDIKTLHWSWMTSSDGKTMSSFINGKKIKYKDNGKDKEFHSLTTDYLETFYDDIKLSSDNEEKGNPECFGIESINISFENYTVPSVDISFTDIKGASLFGQEEYRHRKTQKGIDGYADDNVSGSFFKSFFTIPYPKFILYVKGFYGQPVSYELTCDRFNARFNGNTGNFGATAHFIGYAFSLLTDVSLNALVAAPLSNYVGREYWENTVLKNPSYRLLSPNGFTEMITFSDFMKRLSGIKKEGLLQDLNSKAEDSEMTSQLAALEGLKKQYETCLTLFKEYDVITSDNGVLILGGKFSDWKGNHNKVIEDYNNAVDETSKIVKEWKIWPKLKSVYYNKGTWLDINGQEDRGTHIAENAKDLYTAMNDSFQSWYGTKTNNLELSSVTNFNEELAEISAIFINGLEVNNNLERAISTLTRKKNKDINTIFNSSDDAQKYIDKMGFFPSIDNFVRIIMAHLETLLQIIYQASDSVDKTRKLSDFGIYDNTYTDIKHNSDIVPPWPKLTTKTLGNDSFVDSWIGDYPINGEIQPEANAVNGLLNAVNDVQKEVDIIKKDEGVETNTPNYLKTRYVQVPVGMLELIYDGNPWGNSEIDPNNITSIFAKMVMRGVNVIYASTTPTYKSQGSIDALNFYNFCGKDLPIKTKHMFRTFVETNSNGSVEALKQQLLAIENAKYGKGETKNIISPFRYDNFFPLVNESPTDSINTLRNTADFSLSEEFLPMVNSNELERKKLFLIEDISQFTDMSFDNAALTNNGLNAESYVDDIFENDIEPLIYNDSKVYDYDACFTNDVDGSDINYYGFWHVSPKLVKSIDDTVTDFICEENNGVLPNTKDYSCINSFPFNDTKSPFALMEQGEYDKCHFADVENSSIKKEGIENIMSIGEVKEKLTNFNAVETFTVNSIIFCKKVTSNNRIQTAYETIYLDEDYYDKNLTIEGRALMFLDNCTFHDLHKFYKQLKSQDVTAFYGTKICALMLGAYFLRRDVQCKGMTLEDPTDVDYGKRIYVKNSDIDLSEIEMYHDYFVNFFKEWVKDEYSLFHNAFALHNENGDMMNVDELREFKQKMNAQDTVLIKDIYPIVSEAFFNNYSLYYKNILLFRQSSSIVKQLTKLYFMPILVVKPKYVTDDVYKKDRPFSETRTKSNKRANSLERYLSDFMIQLNKFFINDLNYNPTPVEQEKGSTTNKEIKIGLYKYLKVIYDKWLCTTELKEWQLPQFIQNWHFIDTYYNDIQGKCMINPFDIDKEIKKSQMDVNVTLITMLTNVMANANLSLQTVHNFFDLNNKTYARSMEQMFEPIPLVKMEEPTEKPHFICLYNGEPSNKLDIPDSDFKDDSFMLNDVNTWPVAITSKMNTESCPIPAFGVSFGSQYQSYFTEISVGTESPMTTEQSLKAQFQIAGTQINNDNESSTQVYYVGQDLFTVYSNNSYTCEVTMMGCAWIQPLMYFVLTNVPMFKGSYLIQKVTHTITPGNMVTKFTGTRMANTMTPFILDPMGENKKKDSLSILKGEKNIEQQHKLAKYDNNCPYKTFSVFKYANGKGVDENILNEEGGYAKYCYKQGETRGSATRYNTVLDALTATAIAEGGNDDMTQIKLITTVMFNRWVAGKGFHKYIFNNYQLAYSRFSNYDETSVYSNRDKIRGIVKDIFINTPSILLNESLIAEVPEGKKTQIYENKQLSQNWSQTCNVTEDSLTHMFMFCTRDSYDKSNPRPKGVGPKNSKGEPILVKYPEHFRNQRFLLHHKNHVYTSGDGDLQYWRAESNVDEKGAEPNGLSSFANSLVEAVQKTLETTDAVKDSNKEAIQLHAEHLMQYRDDINAFILSMNANGEASKMGIVFDILLNAYSDNISYIEWCCKGSDAKEENPEKIIVYANDGSSEEFSLVLGSKDNFPTIPTEINKTFLSCLKKHYDISTKDGMKYLRSDCKQFQLEDSEVYELFKNVEVKTCYNIMPSKDVDLTFEINDVEYNMKDMFSEHFSLGVLCGSGRGTIKGNIKGYYIPKNEAMIEKLRKLAAYAEQVNDIYKEYLDQIGVSHNDLAIQITSGLREPTSEKSKSQHIKGEAIDLYPLAGTKKNLFDALFQAIRRKEIVCGQLLWEFIQGNEYQNYPDLVHISNEPKSDGTTNQSFKYPQGLHVKQVILPLSEEYTQYMDGYIIRTINTSV